MTASIKTTVPAGTTSAPIYVDSLNNGAVVACTPGSGGTMSVQASFSPRTDIAAGIANWFTWDLGTVSAPANMFLQRAMAVRFIATTAVGVGEVAQ